MNQGFQHFRELLASFHFHGSVPLFLTKTRTRLHFGQLIFVNFSMQQTISTIRSLVLSAALVVFGWNAQAQSTIDSPQSEAPLKVAEVMPVLRTCEILEDRTARETCTNQGILEHVMAKLLYPENLREAGVEGTVFVEFVINQNGEVEGVKAIRGPEDLFKPAMRVISELPGFVPGYHKGQTVKVQYVLPIRFALTD